MVSRAKSGLCAAVSARDLSAKWRVNAPLAATSCDAFLMY
jgi:hypothetical protein